MHCNVNLLGINRFAFAVYIQALYRCSELLFTVLNNVSYLDLFHTLFSLFYSNFPCLDVGCNRL